MYLTHTYTHTHIPKWEWNHMYSSLVWPWRVLEGVPVSHWCISEELTGQHERWMRRNNKDLLRLRLILGWSHRLSWWKQTLVNRCHPYHCDWYYYYYYSLQMYVWCSLSTAALSISQHLYILVNPPQTHTSSENWGHMQVNNASSANNWVLCEHVVLREILKHKLLSQGWRK